MELRDRLQSALGAAYTVERELGGGGMSRVFLARERSLDRLVVVKLLSGEAVAGLSADRFAREVRLAASLQHPNIVPVLATGLAGAIPYYTMPYVSGESLRARMRETPPLPRREIASILRDIARALDSAHGAGVIHRDIKPENVLLSGSAAVVTDFGIAKAISVARGLASGATNPETQDALTLAGSAIGTPAYMAPEQVAGDTVDYRADLYAWGMIAYELLAGVHPFAEKTSAAQLMAAQVAQLPAPLAERAPGISRSLSDLVMRCLDKSPDARPASAAELVESLDSPQDSLPQLSVPTGNRRRYTALAAALAVLVILVVGGAYAYFTRQPKTSPPITKNSVAVLPFALDAADSADAYFGEGIADELMSALTKVQGLRVASRTSSIAVGRRKDLDVREIGRLLGVSTVVEGTVRRAGGQLRVTAELTNAADGLTLWSDVYQRESKDVFAVQNEITQAIVAALRPALGGNANSKQRTPTGPGTSNPEAYDLYLRGLYLLERRGQGVARSADYFSRAIRKDPNFARAYGGLASALEFFPWFEGVPGDRVEARVRIAAARSLELDPTLAEPRVALAMADMNALRWNDADAEFRRAIAADSTSAGAHTQYGRFLTIVGQNSDALREFQAARRLDPLNGTASGWLSYTLGLAGDHSAAWEESKRSRELDPNLVNSHALAALDLIATKRFADARLVVGKNIAPIPFNGTMAYVLQFAGDTARAAAIRRSLDATPDTVWLVHCARAFAYLATADTARVLSEMEAGLERREVVAQFLPLPTWMFDQLRHSARFAAIVQRSGLEGRGFTPK